MVSDEFDCEIDLIGIESAIPRHGATCVGIRKIPPNVPIDGISFHIEASVSRWKNVFRRRMVMERNISMHSLSCFDIIDLIHGSYMLMSVG